MKDKDFPDKLYLIGLSKRNLYQCTLRQESEEDICYIRADKVEEIISKRNDETLEKGKYLGARKIINKICEGLFNENKT